MEPAGRTLGLVLVVAATASCKYEELPRLGDASPLRPCEMMVSDVSPTVLSEGTGAGGSRPALIVISGQNLVNDNTVVTIAEAGGGTRQLLIEVDSAKIEVGASGSYLAVPIILPVDPSLMAGENALLDVKVEQGGCSEGRVSGTIPGKLTLRGLAELTDANAGMLQGGLFEFSQINVETATLVPAAGQTSPVVLRSMSSVKIVKNIVLDAAGRTGGPAGGIGGTGGSGSGGVGSPGTGPAPGLTSGAPGGFNMSDPGLNTLNNPNRSSGGAGGNGINNGTGGAGGGGGGSIEISAGGDLQVGAISARGAAGASGSGGGADGGGGSGGVILLRAGGMLTAGTLDVRSAGTGARGRARYDAGGMAAVPGGELGTDHLRGPMFIDLPFAVSTPRPELRVSGKPLSSFKHFVIGDGQVSSLSSAILDAIGAARITPSFDLSPGMNQICLITESGTQASETRNCAHIAYLP